MQMQLVAREREREREREKEREKRDRLISRAAFEYKTEAEGEGGKAARARQAASQSSSTDRTLAIGSISRSIRAYEAGPPGLFFGARGPPLSLSLSLSLSFSLPRFVYEARPIGSPIIPDDGPGAPRDLSIIYLGPTNDRNVQP